MTCCHYDEGYDEGRADAQRRLGLPDEMTLSSLVYEWALLQRDDSLRAAALAVSESMHTDHMAGVEELGKRVTDRIARTAREYTKAKVAA